jgi:hypothetical protein
MTRLRRFGGIFFLLALPAGLSAAEWLQLQPARAEAIVRFDGSYRSTNTAPDTTDTDFEYGFRVSRSGYVLDPAIANFFLQLEPYFSDGKSTGTAFNENRDGHFFNYAGRLSLFRGTPGPFSYNFSASKNSGTNDGSLGNRTEYDVTTRFAEMRWKSVAFPTFLQYSERTLDQTFRSGLTSSSTSDRDETLRTLTLAGRSTKMSVNLEHQWLDDNSLSHDNDYEVQKARFAHRLDWNHRSSLDTRANLIDRTGFNAYRQFDFTESANIYHSDTVDSTTTYRHGSVTRVVKSTSDQGEFSLRHRMYRNLTTTAYASGTSIDSDILDEKQKQAGLDFDYRKQDLFGANVNASVGGSYREIDRVSQAGLIDIINEAHIVPLSGEFTLDQRFVVVSSIIVTDSTSTQVYAEGVDYDIFSVASDLTQIMAIPGGQINVGDTILVSYQAENLPSLKYSTTQTDIAIGMDWGWVAVSYSDNRSDDKRISGAAGSFLSDRRNTTADLEFRWERDAINARFGAERRFLRTGDFRTTTYTARQSLSYKASQNVSMTMNISEIFIRSDTQDTDLYILQYSLNWRPSAHWTIRPNIGAWKRKDQGITVAGNKRHDSFLTAGFDLRWRLRKIVLDFRFFHHRRGTDTLDTDENRVMFTLKRKF